MMLKIYIILKIINKHDENVLQQIGTTKNGVMFAYVRLRLGDKSTLKIGQTVEFTHERLLKALEYSFSIIYNIPPVVSPPPVVQEKKPVVFEEKEIVNHLQKGVQVQLF